MLPPPDAQLQLGGGALVQPQEGFWGGCLRLWGLFGACETPSAGWFAAWPEGGYGPPPRGRLLRGKAKPRTPCPGTEFIQNLRSANLRCLIKRYLMVGASEQAGKQQPFRNKQSKGKQVSFNYVYFVMITS